MPVRRCFQAVSLQWRTQAGKLSAVTSGPGLVGALLGGSLGLGTLAGCASVSGMMGGKLIGFESVPVSTADTVTVPKGYVSQVIAAWGEPVGLSGENPAFKFDGKNTAAEQAAQMGMHHDGIHFFPMEGMAGGLLAMNHEYVDDGLLHADGTATWTAEKVRKSQAAHGVSIIEVEPKDGQWQVVRPSPWARRITAYTPMAFGGPAAGHALLRTAADALPGMPSRTLHLGLPQSASAEQIRDTVQSWLQREARQLFEQRCAVYAERLGVRVRRLSLSSATTRWGSASADGSVRLNWRLIHFSLASIDYVVAHELAHLREMNHSAAFWDVVRSVMPDFESRRGQLKDGQVPVFD